MSSLVNMAGSLALAGLLGGIVGYEREIHERPAGLRTHILVCLGSALITLISLSFGPANDPGRIAAQIVSGIGFLGAGTILRQGTFVRGLTTAASLWTVAGIGMAVGVGGQYSILAVIATIIVMLTLFGIKSLETVLWKTLPGSARHDVYLEMSSERTQVLGEVLDKLCEKGVLLQSVHSMGDVSSKNKGFRLTIVLPRGLAQQFVINMLAEQNGVDRFEWS